MMIIRNITLSLLLLSSTIYMQTRTDKLFEETRITLNDALDRNAQIFKPEDFDKSIDHYNRAVEILKSRGSNSSITEELERSITFMTIMNEEIDKSNDFFKSILTSRKAALNINADKFSPYYWEPAEEGLLEAIAEYDDRNYEVLPSLSNNIINDYSRAILYSEKARDLIFNWKPIQKSDSTLAYLLSPESYTYGLEYYFSAFEGLSNGEEISIINQNVAEAAVYFERAASIAKDFAKVYPPLLTARNEARNAGAENYAAVEWLEAEEILKQAGSEFENKEYDAAREYVEEAIPQYKLCKQIAVKERFLFIPRQEIELAKENDADNYSPICFDNALKSYYQAEKLIESESYTEAEVSSLADYSKTEARKANWITNVIKSVEDGENTWEEVFLKWNIWETLNKPEQSQRTEYVKTEPSEKAPVHQPSRLLSNKIDLDRFTEIDMEVFEEGDNILIRVYNINFRPAGWRLNDQSMSVLNQLKVALEDLEGSQYQISAYTDDVGAQRTNIEISTSRAETIVDYLKQESIYLSPKMTSAGYGEENPIADNDNYDGRKKNNRIEILVSD